MINLEKELKENYKESKRKILCKKLAIFGSCLILGTGTFAYGTEIYVLSNFAFKEKGTMKPTYEIEYLSKDKNYTFLDTSNINNTVIVKSEWNECNEFYTRTVYEYEIKLPSTKDYYELLNNFNVNDDFRLVSTKKEYSKEPYEDERIVIYKNNGKQNFEIYEYDELIEVLKALTFLFVTTGMGVINFYNYKTQIKRMKKNRKIIKNLKEVEKINKENLDFIEGENNGKTR